MPFSLFYRHTADQDPNDDRGLKAIIAFMIFGLIAIIVVGIWANSTDGKRVFWSVIGLSGAISLASILSGGFLGFLFGIPRSLQRGASEVAPITNTENNVNRNGQIVVKERPYSNNTNLEQISDWLTKIIVGVSLTQLHEIRKGFGDLTSTVSKGFEKYIPVDFSTPFAASLMIFYAICGFLLVYLWAKIYLLQQLTKLDRGLDGIDDKISRVETKVDSQSDKIELAKLEQLQEDFGKVKNKLKIEESKPEFKNIVEAASPGQVKYIDDSQKERWGGLSTSGGFTLQASFNKTDPLDDSYDLILTVRPVSQDDQLIGDVFFFLHDSYYPDSIKKVTADKNSASISISSYEAFTVGAVCNGGAIKLELDLNNCPNTPEDYKYKEKLVTNEEVKTRIEEIKSRQLEG